MYLQVSSLDLVKSAAKKFVDFVNNGPSPYHGNSAVFTCSSCHKVDNKNDNGLCFY